MKGSLCLLLLACPLVAANEKSVLLWTMNPFGYPGGPVNESKREHFLNATAALKDVVDVMSPCVFILADPASAEANSTGGLVLTEGGAETIRDLLAQGFRVEPLVGDGPSGHHIGWYRHYMKSPAFVDACVKAVSSLGLGGLNFDFEPNDCTTDKVPCDEADGASYGQMLSNLQQALRGKGPQGSDARVSVDTGTDVMTSTSLLENSSVDLLITMNTYGDTKDFDIALARDIQRDGVERFSLGVCPGCFASNESNVAYRMAEATKFGVRHVGYWAGAEVNDNSAMWWSELRKWKKAASQDTSNLFV